MITVNKNIKIATKDFIKFVNSLFTFTKKHNIHLVVNANNVDATNYEAVFNYIESSSAVALDVDIIAIGKHIHIFAVQLITFSPVKVNRYLTITETELTKTRVENPALSITSTLVVEGKTYTESVLLIKGSIDTSRPVAVTTVDFS